MNKKEMMYKRIEQHGIELNNIFHTGLDPIVLCKKLHAIENKAHRIATDYCNGLLQDWQSVDLMKKVMIRVDKILKYEQSKVFIKFNWDCRGYTLKISDIDMIQKDFKLYRDWGGYGIIAPDFSQE